MNNVLVTTASLALLGASASAPAMVTFDSFSDANGASLFYDTDASTDNGDNTLTIAVDDFLVDEAGTREIVPLPFAFDTFTFTINAEPGFFITSIESFEESVSFASEDTESLLIATGSISVSANGENEVRSLGTRFFPGETLLTVETLMVAPFEWDISEQVTSVVVTITNNLTAVGSGNPLEPYSVEKGPATVTVTSAVPLPAPVVLLGSGLATMLFVRRRAA